jgi:hypothetical protein
VGACVTNPRLELLLLDQSLAVRIDQLADLAPHPGRLHLELSLVRRSVSGLLADAQAALVLPLDPARLRQEGGHVGPDRLFQVRAAQRSAGANAIRAHPPREATATAVVDLPPAARAAQGVAAARADQQGPLVLRDNALNLQEQVVLGPSAERTIQKHQLDPAVLQLVHEQRLVSVAPGQAIRRVDVEPLDGAGGRLVAQALKSRAHQGAATVAVVEEAQLLVQRQPLFRHPRSQRLHLASDGVLLSLPLRGHARVNRCARQPIIRGLHDEPPGPSARHRTRWAPRRHRQLICRPHRSPPRGPASSEPPAS